MMTTAFAEKGIAIRKRTRPQVAPQTADATGVTPEMKKLAEDVYRAQCAEAKAKKDAAAALKKLNVAMDKAGVKDFDHSLTVENDKGQEVPVIVDVAWTATTRNRVVNERLLKKCTMEQFVDMASVSQEAVKEKLGTNVLDTVMEPVTGEPKLTVKARK